jgi:hypothetical protein
MDALKELAKLRGFEHVDEIIKTLTIGRVDCNVTLDKILNSPVLPPLSYTNDCLRFITIMRYWRGVHVLKECAKAYRKVIRRDLWERNEFWWGVQELLYRDKASYRTINAYLRRLRRNYRGIMRVRSRIAKSLNDWVLPPNLKLIVGLLPHRMAERVVLRTLSVLVSKSDYFERFGISTLDLAFEMFEKIYKIALMDLTPRDKFERINRFVDGYITFLEMTLPSVCR